MLVARSRPPLTYSQHHGRCRQRQNLCAQNPWMPHCELVYSIGQKQMGAGIWSDIPGSTQPLATFAFMFSCKLSCLLPAPHPSQFSCMELLAQSTISGVKGRLGYWLHLCICTMKSIGAFRLHNLCPSYISTVKISA